MTSVCYTPWKVPRVRVTNLNSCGTPVTGCSTVVSDGIISIGMTYEYEDREEFFVKNGDGKYCVKETNPPILKWINLELTFCNVDPEMVNIITGASLVTNDATSVVATGYNDDELLVATGNFAFEGWTRISGQTTACSGGVEYGYTLFPWVKEATIGDLTFENGTVSFVMNGRTSANSGWGLGPYNIDYSDNPAGSTTPVRLLTPINATTHKRMFLTRMAPPTASCGCTTLSSLTPS